MNVPSRRLVLVLALMALPIAAAIAFMRPMRSASGFHVPSLFEARSARGMFGAAIADAARGRGPGKAADGFGLVASRLEEPGLSGFVLAEPEDRCDGRGAYLLRDAAKRWPVAIMAPHRGADRHTGEIVRLMFAEQPFAAAAWNSAPRRASETCGGGDITREPTHYITAFSLAFAKAYPAGRIVQVHGFDQDIRRSASARMSDVIISDGSEEPGERLLDLADCLSRQFPDLGVSVYPLDTAELGAQSNRQGRALRKAGYAGFAHIEIAAGARARLAADRELRDRFARCLNDGLP